MPPCSNARYFNYLNGEGAKKLSLILNEILKSSSLPTSISP